MDVLRSPRSTASIPSAASATTWRSGAASSTMRRPRRTTVWSSASRIRVRSGTVTRAPPDGLGPALRAAADGEPAAHQQRALPHAAQPDPLPGRPARP